MIHQLLNGDATFCTTFNKKVFGDNGSELTFGFKPPRGRKFVVLLLGTAPKNATEFDIERALNELGFYSRHEDGEE